MFWNLIFTLYLILLSFLDIRKKELPLLLLFAGFPFVILYQIIGRKIGTGSTFFSTSPPSPSLIVSGMAVGIFFLLLSKVTRESFGYGDSILILLIGGWVTQFHFPVFVDRHGFLFLPSCCFFPAAL